MSRPLRFWLSLGLSIQVVLSVLAVALVLLWALVPKIKTEASNQHELLSQAAASQVGHFLGSFDAQLTLLAGDMAVKLPSQFRLPRCSLGSRHCTLLILPPALLPWVCPRKTAVFGATCWGLIFQGAPLQWKQGSAPRKSGPIPIFLLVAILWWPWPCHLPFLRLLPTTPRNNMF